MPKTVPCNAAGEKRADQAQRRDAIKLASERLSAFSCIGCWVMESRIGIAAEVISNEQRMNGTWLRRRGDIEQQLTDRQAEKRHDHIDGEAARRDARSSPGRSASSRSTI